MYKFIFRVVVFTLPIVVIYIIILTQANGFTDPFYLRFASPKQESLILGTSRAAQGIRPTSLKEVLKKDIYNYAFTILHSPYGPVYYESVRRKLKPSKNGVFILAVDPWSISSTSLDPNDSLNFRENALQLGRIPIVNMNPNFYYSATAGRSFFRSILFPEKTLKLHENGWLEVLVKRDSVARRIATIEKIEFYRRDVLPKFNFSSMRLNYLNKLIRYLKQYGKVYLVRIPIHPEMMKIEQELIPDFNHKIKESVQIADGYFDLTVLNDQVLLNDGNHLNVESAAKVTNILANKILELN
jgi:hypothetical protein